MAAQLAYTDEILLKYYHEIHEFEKIFKDPEHKTIKKSYFCKQRSLDVKTFVDISAKICPLFYMRNLDAFHFVEKKYGVGKAVSEVYKACGEYFTKDQVSFLYSAFSLTDRLKKILQGLGMDFIPVKRPDYKTKTLETPSSNRPTTLPTTQISTQSSEPTKTTPTERRINVDNELNHAPQNKISPFVQNSYQFQHSSTHAAEFVLGAPKEPIKDHHKQMVIEIDEIKITLPSSLSTEKTISIINFLKTL